MANRQETDYIKLCDNSSVYEQRAKAIGETAFLTSLLASPIGLPFAAAAITIVASEGMISFSSQRKRELKEAAKAPITL